MGYELFAYAIVVALMAIYVYNNERRMAEMFYKLDQTALANIEQKHKFELLEIEIRNNLMISNLQKEINDIRELAQQKQQKLDSLNEKMVDIEKKNEMKLQYTENRNNLTISNLQKQISDMTELGKY
ncbi:uncharacterized protein LOC134702025 [Mytilus trossulus]|uniref:uncharacterized protein LOC134702025 n=1 Tax=Mytilus trossulus TaxID=6551 RepID=UPI003003FB79